MTERELSRLEAIGSSDEEGYPYVAELCTELRLLRATIEQQAAWLREITTERDALKLRVAELEEELTIRLGKGECQQCGAEFRVQSANQRFCTERCRNYAASVKRRS